MSYGLLEAAGVGHRITHEGDLSEAREIAGALFGVALLAAALDDDAPRCPDPCGAIEHGSPDTFLGRDRRAAALAGHDEVPCDRCADEAIAEGSATVFVNHKPLARRADEVGCGAHIGAGEPTVLVGAAPNERGRARDPLSDALLNALRGRPR